MNDEELLSRATVFELFAGDPNHHIRLPRIRQLGIARRSYVHDTPSWVIMSEGTCLNHDGVWEYEPSPSNRDEDFFKRCRWSDLREAITFAQNHMEKYPSGYKPEQAKN